VSRPFITGGVWTFAAIRDCDAHVQGKATLRVSALAGLITLGLLAGPEFKLADSLRTQAVSPAITAPEMISAKGQDRIPAYRIPAFGDVTSATPARRRPRTESEAVILAAAPAAPSSPAPLDSIEIIDAVTLRTGSMIVRLAGIHTPASDQSCRRLDGLTVSCADRALSYLQLIVKGKAVACDRAGYGPDGIEEGRCRIGDADIAEQMVRQGWAKAAEQPEERLMVAEAAARKQKLGLWRE
jgi:endonuclease YncB( thermonuclease family)